MKKKKMGKREREKGKRRGRGGARQRRPRLRSATRGVRPREVGHAVGGERGKRRGGIRGGWSRRVALDGKEMRRGLNSGVGSDLRGSGDRSRRVSGKLGLGFKSSSTIKTILAHDLLGEFSGCYKPTPLKM